MNSSKFIECERKSVQKLLNTRLLPRPIKTIGFVLAGLAMASIVALKLSGGEMETLRFVLRSLLIGGLLLAAVSRNKVEDEMTIRLRGQAFTLAFVTGAIYALLMPLFDYAVDKALTASAILAPTDSITIILVMLMVQIGYFEVFRRFA